MASHLAHFILLFLTSSVFLADAIAVPTTEPHQHVKRFDATWKNCGNYGAVKTGLQNALAMAEHAADILQNPSPNAFHLPVRNALFGDESKSPVQTIIDMYHHIASPSAFTVICGEPAGYAQFNIGCTNPDNPAHGYRIHVDPNPTDPDDIEFRKNMLSWGFSDGDNIVACDDFLKMTGLGGYKALSDLHPSNGAIFNYYKLNWGCFFVHEISHMYGTLDYQDPGYGFDAAVKIQQQASGNKQPTKNADTFSLFALAVSRISDPTFEVFEWSNGFGRPYRTL